MMEQNEKLSSAGQMEGCRQERTPAVSASAANISTRGIGVEGRAGQAGRGELERVQQTMIDSAEKRGQIIKHLEDALALAE